MAEWGKNYGAELANKELHQEINLLRQHLKDSQMLAHCGSWEFAVTTSENWWSQEMFALFDFDLSEKTPSLEEVLTRVHPDDAEMAAQSFRRVIEHQESYEFQVRMLHRDGSCTMWARSASPMPFSVLGGVRSH